MKVRLLAEADAEAKEAACWYDDRQTGLGDEFLDALAKRLQKSSSARTGSLNSKRSERSALSVARCFVASPTISSTKSCRTK